MHTHSLATIYVITWPFKGLHVKRLTDSNFSPFNGNIFTSTSGWHNASNNKRSEGTRFWTHFPIPRRMINVQTFLCRIPQTLNLYTEKRSRWFTLQVTVYLSSVHRVTPEIVYEELLFELPIKSSTGWLDTRASKLHDTITLCVCEPQCLMPVVFEGWPTSSELPIRTHKISREFDGFTRYLNLIRQDQTFFFYVRIITQILL